MAYKIGIPRAMLYFKYYIMWSTFLRELGAEVVVSEPTNYPLITQGASRVVSDTCLPLKVFIGHVHSLVNKCDYILIPILRSNKKKVLNCSRFLGLPDVARAVVPNSPPILEIEFDMNRGRSFLYKEIYNLGRLFSQNPLKIKQAAYAAWETHRKYQEKMADLKRTHNEAIGMYEGAESKSAGKDINRFDESKLLNIGLIGHAYVLDDETINHRIQTLLRNFSVRITTPEMFTAEQLLRGMKTMISDAYWVSEDEVIGAGGSYLEGRIDGIIGVMAFGCGPDSLMMYIVQRKARSMNVPFMCLTLDEHTAEAGIITRLEAFTDMIRRRCSRRNTDAGYVSSYR
ncbi:MAG: hypothetical protein JW967_01445 [Dehalococcoidales bacterium]|nr:hypothetical protein [Dehalococcoidales bacterium]